MLLQPLCWLYWYCSSRAAAAVNATESRKCLSRRPCLPRNAEVNDSPDTAAAQALTQSDAQNQGTSMLPTATPELAAGQPPSTPLPSPTPASGSLTLWHSWAQSDGDALEAILQDFRTRHPGVQVETLFVAQDDLLQSYAQAVADGSGPDIVLAPNWWLFDLQELGVVAPVDEPPFAALVPNVWPAAADNLRVDGRLYGLPTRYETVALFYNRSLLGGDDLPRSLEELSAQAAADPAKGIGVYANPFHIAWGFPAFGAEFFDDTGRSILDQSPGAASFLNWLATVDGFDGSYVNSDYGMLLDRFKRGEFAFFIDGPWAIPELSEALGSDLGVASIPPGPAGAARPWLYADAAYVRPGLSAPQAELASLFLAHLTSAPSSGQIATLARRLPAAASADLGADPLLQGFAAQAALADGMAHGAHMDAFWRYGGDMILRAVAGADDLQTIVSETAALINETTGN